MKRTTLNLLIDLTASILFVGMIATGYILFFALPPGTNKSLSLWQLTRHEWGQIHFWISLGLLAVLFTHVVLHWQWFVATLAQRLGLARKPQARHFWIGAITLLILVTCLSLFGWIAHVSVRELGATHCPPEEVRAGVAITGPVNFWGQVYPIFETSCLPCHNDSNPRGRFRADRREDYFGNNGKVAYVISGKSAESPLIAIVTGLRTGMAMAANHKLPERDVDLLRAWIDSGAEWPNSREQNE